MKAEPAEKLIYGFEALHDKDAEFKSLLGEFVMVWADTEGMLYQVLVYYSKTSDAVARAIFSGTRAKGMIDYMRGIIHNIKIAQSRKSDLEFLFCQIGAINTIRDRIIHFSSDNWWQWDSSATRTIDNSSRVSRYGKHWIEKVNISTLENIVTDLYSIQNHLTQHRLSPKKRPFYPFEQIEGAPTTWLYKPSQPIQKKAKPQTSLRKRLHPQSASQR